MVVLYAVLGLLAFIFLGVALFYAKMALCKAFDLMKEEKLGEIKVGKVQEEYVALNPLLHLDTKGTHDCVWLQKIKEIRYVIKFIE